MNGASGPGRPEVRRRQAGAAHQGLGQELVGRGVEGRGRGAGIGDAHRVQHLGRQMDQPPLALQRLDQVDHDRRGQGPQAAQAAEIQPQRDAGDAVAQPAQRRPHLLDLDQRVALVGRGVGRDVAVDDGGERSAAADQLDRAHSAALITAPDTPWRVNAASMMVPISSR